MKRFFSLDGLVANVSVRVFLWGRVESVPGEWDCWSSEVCCCWYNMAVRFRHADVKVVLRRIFLQPWMSADLLEWKTILWVFSQTAQQQCLELNRHKDLLMIFNILEPDFLVANFSPQIAFTLTLKGQTPKRHLEQHDTHGPNVRFHCVNVRGYWLRRHVHRSSYVKRVFWVFIQVLDKPEIRNHINWFLLTLSWLNENVGWFYVPVDEASWVKVLVTVVKLGKDLEDLLLLEEDFLFEFLGQIASIVQFCNDIAVIRRHERIDISKQQ